MPAIERVIPLVNHLPTSLRDALVRRLRELAGLGLIALCGVAAAALMTWSVQDPSLSHATSRAIRNIVGYPGAIGADLLMQILGLGSIMAILPIAIRGWRMMTHRPFDREALRFGAWVLGAAIAAGFASCWPRSHAWPLPTGLGGVVGDALVRAPAVVFGPPGLIYRLVLGSLLLIAMIGCLLVAGGMGAKEADPNLAADEEDDTPLSDDEDDDDRKAIRLGWGFHAIMSAKAQIGWFLSTAYRALVSSGPQPRSAASGRQEPSLVRGQKKPTLAPEMTEEDDEE
ncbi:MAG: DNA translocase FtsK 4TM domain-containing protein, partial [Streptococcus sp.]|nr:DNA translocase FtsK 4TM domain-containing protein [Streptococcus sp.]